MDYEIALFENIYELLKNNPDAPYALECTDCIEHGLVVLTVAEAYEREQMLQGYLNRYSLGKRLGGHIDDYPDVIKGMIYCTHDKIMESHIDAENCGFTIVTDEFADHLVGILRPPFANAKQTLAIRNHFLLHPEEGEEVMKVFKFYKGIRGTESEFSSGN